MKALKWIMICAMLVTGMMSASAQPGGDGTRTRGAEAGARTGEARPERPESTLSPEERAKQAEAASLLAATVVAEKMTLSKEAAAKFVTNYTTAAKESRAKMEELRSGQDREAMMTAMRADREKMAEVLKKDLTEEQAKIATMYLGGFSSLERTIQGLQRAKVDEAKTKKAMPVILKYIEDLQKLMPAREARGGAGAEAGGRGRGGQGAEAGAGGPARGGQGGEAGAGGRARGGQGAEAGAGGRGRGAAAEGTEAVSAEERAATRVKLTELREKYTKDLTEIIGEEAIKAMGGQRGGMMMRGERGTGQGGRTRPAGAATGAAK